MFTLSTIGWITPAHRAHRGYALKRVPITWIFSFVVDPFYVAVCAPLLCTSIAFSTLLFLAATFNLNLLIRDDP